jgi:hypothetical protein
MQSYLSKQESALASQQKHIHKISREAKLQGYIYETRRRCGLTRKTHRRRRLQPTRDHMKAQLRCQQSILRHMNPGIAISKPLAFSHW